MKNKRVFNYLNFGPADSTMIIKTPNGPANFTIFVKSTTVDDTATIAVNGSFVAAPANEDLVEVIAATAVEGFTTVDELVAPTANKYPYLQIIFNSTSVGAADIISEAYIGFY